MTAVTKAASATDAFILAGARTPQGKFLGALQQLTAPQLGQFAVKAVVERSGIDPADVDEIILGQVVGTGAGLAVARQVWIGAGYPDRVGAPPSSPRPCLPNYSGLRGCRNLSAQLED